MGWANYVRVPARDLGAAALVFFPVMLGKGEAVYTRVSGRAWDGYARPLALVCARRCSRVLGGLYLVRTRAGSSS